MKLETASLTFTLLCMLAASFSVPAVPDPIVGTWKRMEQFDVLETYDRDGLVARYSRVE